MTEHKNHTNFYQETTQHNNILRMFMCSCYGFWEVILSWTYPQVCLRRTVTQWSAGPWATWCDVHVSSTLGWGWTRWAPVVPSNLSWTPCWCKTRGEEGWRRSLVEGPQAAQGEDTAQVAVTRILRLLSAFHGACANCSLNQVLFWQLKMRETVLHEGIQAVPIESKTTSFTPCVCQSHQSA